MARMRTGRLTNMTTPPQKPTVKSVSNQAEWDKYDQDYKAYKNYDSDVKSYQEKKKAYDESKLPRNYALFGGKGNTRSLSSSELADYNKRTGSNYSKVEVNKNLKNVGERDWFFGEMEKPVAPQKRTMPNAPELPLDKMPLLKAGKVTVSKSLKKGKPAAEPELGTFIDPGKVRKYKSDKSNLRNDHRILGVDFTASRRTNPNTGRKKLSISDVHIDKANKPGGYNKEKRQFRAYASNTVTGDNFVGMSPADIRSYRKSSKQALKDYRKEDPSVRRAEGMAATKMEIKQSRKAERFARGPQAHFNDKNYRGNITSDFKNSNEHVVIRDNMAAKIKAAGEKYSKNAQFNDQMPK